MPSKRQAAKLTTLFRSCSVLILRNLTNTWKTRYSVIRAGLTGQDGEEKTNSWEAGLYYILEPLRMRQVDVISQDFATYSRRFLTENRELKNHDDVCCLGKDWNENVRFGGKKET